MAHNNNYLKKLRAEKKRKKRQEKEEKKAIRRNSSLGGSLENMMAYVDEFGNLSATPPPKRTNESENKNKQ
ncbi:MAG: cold-shock protein [Cyclobacteriaceae bacterium]